MNARPVPVSPDDIDVAWLNAAMGHGRTPYASVRIEPVAGGFYGASARVTATASEHSQPPTRFFAKCASPSPALRESLGRSGVYRNEYDFYTRLADAFPVRVPRCHFAYYDPASHHTLLLLEWLEGEFGDRVRGANRTQATKAVDAAREMHRHWSEPGRLDAHPWLRRITESPFFSELARIDAEHAERALAVLGDLAPAWLRQHAPRTGRILRSQYTALDALPSTLLHFDYQNCNMRFAADGSPTILDWQLLMRGPGIVDVCTFLIYTVPSGDRRAWQQDLLERYLDSSRVPDGARTAFGRMALVLAFNLVRSASVFDVENAEHMAVMTTLLERSCAAVEDLDALALVE